jgi:hypothetical protein
LRLLGTFIECEAAELDAAADDVDVDVENDEDIAYPVDPHVL